jgi:hypothetical protein
LLFPVTAIAPLETTETNISVARNRSETATQHFPHAVAGDIGRGIS